MRPGWAGATFRTRAVSRVRILRDARSTPAMRRPGIVVQTSVPISQDRPHAWRIHADRGPPRWNAPIRSRKLTETSDRLGPRLATDGTATRTVVLRQLAALSGDAQRPLPTRPVNRCRLASAEPALPDRRGHGRRTPPVPATVRSGRTSCGHGDRPRAPNRRMHRECQGHDVGPRGYSRGPVRERRGRLRPPFQYRLGREIPVASRYRSGDVGQNLIFSATRNSRGSPG